MLPSLLARDIQTGLTQYLTAAYEPQEKSLEGGASVERTVLDDTLPGGPHQKKQKWVAPFATASRESDYAIAWEFFAV